MIIHGVISIYARWSFSQLNLGGIVSFYVVLQYLSTKDEVRLRLDMQTLSLCLLVYYSRDYLGQKLIKATSLYIFYALIRSNTKHPLYYIRETMKARYKSKNPFNVQSYSAKIGSGNRNKPSHIFSLENFSICPLLRSLHCIIPPWL